MELFYPFVVLLALLGLAPSAETHHLDEASAEIDCACAKPLEPDNEPRRVQV